tara:strand:- start:18599 stop:19351 length:753 start_codon:yes stop_codon:yes gene_type:complete
MDFRCHIVLVRPIYPSNIGFCARVAANMGMTSLSVISEKDLHLEHESKQRAAGAQDMLRQARHFSTWEDFFQYSGKGLRVAFTRRSGKKRQTPLWNDLLKELPYEQMHQDNIRDIYLFFGPEDDGLSAEDLRHLNWHAQLPIYGNMGSLNLAHAVLLAAFIFQNHFHGTLKLSGTAQSQEPIDYDDTYLRQWLECLGMDNSHPTKSAAVALHKMILRAFPTRREWDIWHNVLNSTIRLLKKLKEEDRRQR